MAIAVEPFGLATAELSDEFINVFPDPDIVPNYLEKVRDKTGVQLLTGVSTICVKGSWMSLKRVRSFLTEFLVSYQNVNDNEHKVDLSDRRNRVNRSDQEECRSDQFDNSLLQEEEESRLLENAGDRLNWMQWRAEILPTFQQQTKRAHVIPIPKSQAGSIPEPFVILASYQPSPDPSAKKAPTLDAIEKALKTVYDKDKAKDVPSSYDDEEVQAPLSTDAGTIDPQNQGQGPDHAKETYPIHFYNQAGTPTADQNCSPNSACDQKYNIHDTSVEDIIVAAHSHSANSATNLSHNSKCTILSQNSLVKTVELPQGGFPNKTQIMESGNAATYKDNKQTSKRKSDRKRKMRTEEVCNLATESMCGTGAQSVDESVQLKVETLYESQPVIPAATVSSSNSQDNDVQKSSKSTNETNKPVKIGMGASAAQKTSRAERAAKRGILRTESSKAGPNSKRRKRSPEIKSDPITKDVEADYVCDLCSYVAKKRSFLREHKRRVHITKEFKCDLCGKIFGLRKDLKRHSLTHQQAENCCDICGKMYKSVRTLAEHRKTHETDYIKPEFPCEFCQKIFSTKYVLAYHIKAEHLGIRKSYICPTCGKSFSQKNSYLQHANVHVGIKPYQCDICGRSFSYDKSLKEHKHMHEDDKQFECEICHKKFRQSSGVAIHMKIHKDRKDYVCSACGKGFSQKQALIRHERIHLGEKPFACSLCQRTFTDSSILRRHMILIHKKEKTKWREDTESHVQRRTDFFISVVGKDVKVKKQDTAIEKSKEIAGDDQSASRITLTVPDGVGNDCPAQNVNYSVGPSRVSVSGSVLSLVPSIATSALVTGSLSTDSKMKQCTAAETGLETNLSTQSLPASICTASARVHPNSIQTETGRATSSGHSESKEPSAQPIDMSSHNQLSAQDPGIFTDYTFNEEQHLPHSQLYTGDLQQQMTSVSVAQFHSTDTDSENFSQAAILMMSGTLNSSQQTFHSESGVVTTPANSVQMVDYGSLVPHPLTQEHQYAHTQE